MDGMNTKNTRTCDPLEVRNQELQQNNFHKILRSAQGDAVVNCILIIFIWFTVALALVTYHVLALH